MGESRKGQDTDNLDRNLLNDIRYDEKIHPSSQISEVDHRCHAVCIPILHIDFPVCRFAMFRTETGGIQLVPADSL